MAKAPDLSPLALSLVDKLLTRLPASVSDLETWWGKQGKVTRLELVRLLRQLDGDRLMYDRDAGTVKPLDLVTARAGRGGVKAGDLVVVSPEAKSPHLFTVVPVPGPTMRDVEAAAKAAETAEPSPPTAPRFVLPPSVLGAGILTVGHGSKPDPGQPLASDPSAPVTAVVGGVTISGSSAAVKEAAKAYQRALLSQPTPRPPARRGPAPSPSSVSERVRVSVCRKPGTVGEVIARFPDENPNTIRGALGTLKARGTVSHTDGKYGAPRD